MSYCLNPYCRQPKNPGNANTCSSCNSTILLDRRYRPIQFLGGGGQGRNYLAIDERTPTKKRCVIKQFCPHPNIANDSESLKKATELFNREATILDSIGDESPQIPRLLAHLEQEGFLYFVQEFIDGNNLLSLLAQKGTYSEAEVNDFLNEILPVLKFIHNRSVIHRDIKPENIMRRKDGLFVLIDFGLSKQLSSTVMVIGTIGGTTGYSPREQLVYGEAYPASDLYALGATCIHLLTGIPPYNLYNPKENRWLWQDVLQQRGVQVSDYLSQILNKMLMDNVGDRYQSVDEVLNVIVAKTYPVQPPPKTPQNPIKKIFNTFKYPVSCIQTINTKAINHIEFHPDGQSLASAYSNKGEKEGIDLWNWRTGALINHYEGCYWVSFHPDGKRLATHSGMFRSPIKVLDISTGKVLQSIELKSYGYFNDALWSPISISPDGKLIASTISGTFIYNKKDLFKEVAMIRIWSLESGESIYELSGHYEYSECLSFAPSSDILASGSGDETVKIWNLSTGNLLYTLADSSWNLESIKNKFYDYTQQRKDGIKTISFHPQGNLLASGGWDNLIKIWNPETGQLINTFSGHKDAINSIAFSPDGQVLASGSNDNTIKLWEVSTGKEICTLNGHTGYVSSVAFSPDGKVLASGSNDQTIKIWQWS